MPKDTKEVENKVIKILSDKLDIDIKKIKPESRLSDDLGMDSFGAVEMVFALEEEFKIDIPETDLADVKLVNDIIKYIKSKNEKC